MSSAFSQSAYQSQANYEYDSGLHGSQDTWGSFGPVAQYFQNLGGGLDYQRTFNLAEYDRAFNSQEALANRQWEEYMSNTAYQRQVADMKKAGLNPYLALGAGGASSPNSAPAASRSGSFSSGNNPAATLTSLISHVVSGAFSIAKTSLNNEKLENLAELRHANAYDMQARRFENQRERDFLKHEFNKTYKRMDYDRATSPRESHVWHYDGNRRR